MNRFLEILFCALILLTAEAVTAQNSLIGELVPQIKVTRTQIWYVNSEFIDKLAYSIAKRNATFNDVYTVLFINNDLPEDVYFKMNVYASDPEHQNGTLLLSEDIPICKNHTNHHLLPNGLVMPDSELNSICLKKDHTVVGLMNNFRFEVLIPNIHEISDYHYVDMIVLSKDLIICNVTYYSEWGYRNID